MIIILFALIDIHTLFVLLFHSHLPAIYVFSGSSFAILKGLIFFIPTRDIFSLLDILVGCIMLFLLVAKLATFVNVIVGLFLLYKIVMSLAFLK